MKTFHVVFPQAFSPHPTCMYMINDLSLIKLLHALPLQVLLRKVVCRHLDCTWWFLQVFYLVSSFALMTNWNKIVGKTLHWILKYHPRRSYNSYKVRGSCSCSASLRVRHLVSCSSHQCFYSI